MVAKPKPVGPMVPQAQRQPIFPVEDIKTLHFPWAGINVVCPTEQQPNEPSPTDKTDYGRTTPLGINVRAFELATQRRRGASRAGLAKYISGNAYLANLTGTWFAKPPVSAQQSGRARRSLQAGHYMQRGLVQPAGRQPVAQIIYCGRNHGTSIFVGETVQAGLGFIQHLQPLTYTIDPKSGAKVQPSTSGRAVTLVAVSAGQVVVAQAGDQAWTATVNNTKFNPPLNARGVVFSSPNLQKLYFADGSNWCFYVPKTNSVETWTASKGTLPVDSAGNAPRLIATWRGRTVLSGLLYDPQDVFFSRVSDPTDWDYAPKSPAATDPMALNVGQMGFVGDVVTALIPYTNDTMLIGGDHELHMLQGDPMAGGQLDLISDTIGVAWGMAWCKDPYGVIYFISNRMGVYQLTPGQNPIRISQAIEPLLQDLDSGQNTFSMCWDDRYQGCHLFVTPTAGSAPATHYFYEVRTNGWFQDQFANNDHNPLCCVIYDGNLPNDRVALIGSWDGFVRFFNPAAADDDGYPIQSAVVIGPLNAPEFDDLLLKDVQAVLAEQSGDVNFDILVGSSAENALNSTPIESGTWSAGRNLSTHVRYAGHGIYVRITSTNIWAMEGIRLRLEAQGKVRQRGF
jgi:hypothetical protein